MRVDLSVPLSRGGGGLPPPTSPSSDSSEPGSANGVFARITDARWVFASLLPIFCLRCKPGGEGAGRGGGGWLAAPLASPEEGAVIFLGKS